MRYLLGRLAWRTAGRLSAWSWRLLNDPLPASIEVDGLQVERLQPLGNKRTPGWTKVGRVSYAGRIGGRKVKVYGLARPEQGALRVALAQTAFGRAHLPRVLACDGRLVVEEWIQGAPVSAPGERAALLQALQEDGQLTELAVQHADSFDYLDDYLQPRLAAWSFLQEVDRYLACWQAKLGPALERLPVRLVHPDLTPANVLRADTGEAVIVDNELLGAGRGWIIAAHNAGLPAAVAQQSALAERCWALRRLGTLFDQGRLKCALRLAVRETQLLRSVRAEKGAGHAVR